MRTSMRTGLAAALLLAGTTMGCTGTGDGAAQQMRAAFGSDQLPDQTEPDVDTTNDEFQPDFGD